MVGPASSVPRPPGAPSAPKPLIVCITRTPSARDRPLPYHSTGHVGTAHPDGPSRPHHSSTVRSGSQCSSSQAVTSAVRSSVGAPRCVLVVVAMVDLFLVLLRLLRS